MTISSERAIELSSPRAQWTKAREFRFHGFTLIELLVVVIIIATPSMYHGRACGISFADGHSEIHNWTDSRSIFPMTHDAADGSLAPIASPNNPDIAWLQERTSALK